MRISLLKALTRMLSPLMAWSLRRRGHMVGSSVRFAGRPIISIAAGSRVLIGSYVHLVSSSDLATLGVAHPVILRTLAPGAVIDLGDNVGITGGTICAARRVEIGAGTMLGANVTIADTDFHPIESLNRRYAPRPLGGEDDAVIIGRNVFIGTGAHVLKGARIGANSVIGAGSVVTGMIPPNSIAVGSPAKVVRRFDPPEMSDSTQSSDG